MRRYDDPVEVRKGRVSGIEAPEQFLWRGRLWKVRAVLAHWVETGPWWQSSGVRAMLGSDDVPAEATGTEQTAASRSLGQLMAERELWRVEAGRGPGGDRGDSGDGGGVFDLSFDSGDGHWQLVGCVD